ncbi:hypothetical protein SESBI_50880 [Sesbania bispinosa]|nr:hypothetical protein SESBI_50880 [Sesbania bispinosa]
MTWIRGQIKHSFQNSNGKGCGNSLPNLDTCTLWAAPGLVPFGLRSKWISFSVPLPHALWENGSIPVYLKPQRMLRAYSLQAATRYGTSSATSTSNPSNVSCWSRPTCGTFKINVDAAHAGEDKWGIGIVVRDDKGMVLAAACRRIVSLPDPGVAEAMGARLAIIFAKDMV